MDMTGEYRIPAPRERVWDALNDPEILRQAIPGCDAIDKTSDTEMTARVSTRIGPVSAKFAGKVTLTEMDPPNGYTISGEGTGGAAGFAKGGATVRLLEDGDGTILRYTAKAQVGGKLAQIGSRLVDSTARKMADEFFGRFAGLVGDPGAPGATAAIATPAPAGAPAPAGSPTVAGAGPTPGAGAAGQAAVPPTPLPPHVMADPVEPGQPTPGPVEPTVAEPALDDGTTGGVGIAPLIWVGVLVVVVVGGLYFISAG